jgi:UDP-N-acetylmuramyl pentapeptide phosphotransferase/UDP-N-acetylglucosamine-1-phosphate transferase
MAEGSWFDNNRKWLVWLAVVLGVVLIVIAVIYWAEPAGSLPSFFPGHEAGSSHHHVKHGIAAFFVGLACLAFAWFNTGPKGTAPKKGADQTPPDAG